KTRPAPFGYSLAEPSTFYYATLIAFLATVAAVTIFVRSPFGAALMGTRDQPRRMNALGYHVWAIRFWACLLSGLLTAVSAILFVYYTQFISPQTLSLTSSAEVLLMVISGGAGTLLGPIMGAGLVVVVKKVVRAFIERWNRSAQDECLNHVVMLSESMLRHYVTSYIQHYNTERPHQGIGNVPVGPWRAGTGDIVCDESLNGLLKSFRRAA
ncbi:MAG: integrase core domain-containing protein, partial [Planctomycetota bacterium]